MLDNAHAVIIGIDTYKNINPLCRSCNDAQDIHDLLIDEGRCGYPPPQVLLLKDLEADRAAIVKALDELAARTDADATVFIFMACHGGRLESGPYAGQYILPVDVDYTNEETIFRSAISGDLFAEKLRRITARKVVVVLDCCHAGGIGRPRQAGSPELKRGLTDAFQKELAQGVGRVIFASASEDEAAWEMAGDRNGLFTKHLLAGLRGNAGGSDKFVRIFELFDYVQKQVVMEKSNQNPVFKAEARDNFPIALRLGGKRTGDAGGAESHEGTKANISEDQLLDTLGRLQRAEFEELLFRLKMPKKLRPAKELAQGDRAVAVLDWVLEPESGVGLNSLWETLTRVLGRPRQVG
jgi:hypothetical protein